MFEPHYYFLENTSKETFNSYVRYSYLIFVSIILSKYTKKQLLMFISLSKLSKVGMSLFCFIFFHLWLSNCLQSQEFLVLGQQCLTEFRDQIYCITDEIMRKADKDDPSGYFLIEVNEWLNITACLEYSSSSVLA